MWQRTVLEVAEGVSKIWAEIKTDAKKSEMEDSCGSLVFRGGMMGCYIQSVPGGMCETSGECSLC